MSETQRVIISTCIIMMLRQIKPFVSNSFTSFLQSEFFQVEYLNTRQSREPINQVHVSTTNFLWIIAPLFVLLFPAPNSFRCKSVLIYDTILELFRSYLFYMSLTNSGIKAALSQVSPIFEIFFSTTTATCCIYLYNKVDDRTKNQKITLYICTSILIGVFINTYYIQMCSNLKTDYFEMESNYIAVPILILMLFILTPQSYEEKKDLAATLGFLEEKNKPRRVSSWMKFWNDFTDVFRYTDVRKWSVCWWLHDTLLIGMTQEFTKLLTHGIFTDISDALEWLTWINSLGLLASAMIIGLLAHTTGIVWKTYINWISCAAPFYYVWWSIIGGVPFLWIPYYIYCAIIFRVTFAISISQLAKYVPTDKHVVVFCFNSTISLALKMAVLKASEMFYFTDVIFKTTLVISMAIFGKTIFNSATQTKNMEAW